MEDLVIRMPNQIKNNFHGLSSLNELLFKVQYNEYDRVILDFSRTRWFEANLPSMLGIAVEETRKRNAFIGIKNITNSVSRIFKKNGFYGYYNLETDVDVFNSTIEFKVFNVESTDEFANYVSREVIPKIRMTVDKPIQKSLISSLNEIFINVDLHAKSNYIYTCGQYYHKQKMVAFTIADLGRTITDNFRDIYKNTEISDPSAINWATKYGNTTRHDGSVGGIGLHIIDEFLTENKGEFQIISGSGFFERNGGLLTMQELDCHFPGTVVNIITKLESTSFNWSNDILF